MPPEKLPPWDRKGQSFRKPKHRYEYAFHHHNNHHNNGGGYGGGGGRRWRESPPLYSPYAVGFRNYSEFRRPTGHGKQGGWRPYQEESPRHGYATPHFGDYFLDNYCFRPSAPNGNVKFSRFYDNNRKGYGRREWRGRSWENNQRNNGLADTSGRPPIMNDQRSVGDSRISPSQPNSNPSAQLDYEDQTDKTGHVDGSGVSQRICMEDSLETLDWKPLKWSSTGSLRSRNSGFSCSSGPKHMGRESSDVNDELDMKTKSVTLVRSPGFPEETGSRKKPRLGWGEGLSKFENKKVDGTGECVVTTETIASGDNVEPSHLFTSNLVDKSSESTGFSACLSPATPLPFACNSSPGLAEKTSGRVTEGDSNNVSVSLMLLSENQAEGMQFSLKKLELSPIADGDSSNVRVSGLAEKTSGRVTDGDSNNVSVSSMLLSENQAEGMQFSLKKLELSPIADGDSSNVRVSGLAEKTSGRVTDGDSNNVSVSSMLLCENQAEGMQFSLKKLELSPIADGDSSNVSLLSMLPFENQAEGMQFSLKKLDLNLITDGDSNNVSLSSMFPSENQAEMQFNLKKLELNSITDLSFLLNELLREDDQLSRDSVYMRSSATNKLMLWKREISKSLELTETEIDSLESKLDSLKEDSCRGTLYPSLSGSSFMDDNGVHFDGLNDCSGLLQKPEAEGEDEEIVTPGSASSISVEPPLLLKGSPIVPENLVTYDCMKTTEETHSLCDDANAVKGRSSVVKVENPGVRDVKVFNIVDIILASNKETASKASGVLSNLLPTVETGNVVDGMNEFGLSCLGPDAKIKKKLSRKRQLLKFKERIILLKYRALNFLWKEDLRLLSLGRRTKRQKKLAVTSQTMKKGNQKHTRLSIRGNSASPASSSSLVPTAKILHSIGELLSVCNMKMFRSSLKMPAMILDEKDKVSSKFVSTNGLVEDPWEVEKERALFNPWTITEKEIYMEKLDILGKDFRKIASFIEHKTVADCIEFYYKNHKSESFVKTKKKLNVKKRAKPLSSDTFMLTSDKNFGREPNSASLDVLGAASAKVAQADRKLKAQQLRQVANNEQDSLTASISSCVTTSIDGKFERKPQKVGSIATELMSPKSVESEVDIFPEECYGEDDLSDWTNDERLLFLRAFSSHGKDFVMISRYVRTKTKDQCKVFFSKARKCLHLETPYPESCPGGLLGSNVTNGSGSNVEDDFIDTGSVDCCVDSDSRMDEELHHMGHDVFMCDSTSSGIMLDFPDLGHGEVVDDTQSGDVKGSPVSLSTNAPVFQKQFIRKCSHVVPKNAVVLG